MIISASRRTDIPALYPDWFINRLNSGYLYVNNPMNKIRATKVILSPETVECIAFWTKNPQPILEKLHLIDRYNYYFQFTITAYDSSIEKNLPEKQALVETFIRLSDMIGPEKVIWRYDPVFFTEKFNPAKHLQTFEYLVKKLSGYTNTCMFSYLTAYDKCKKNMQHLKYFVPETGQATDFAQKLSAIALCGNIMLKSCSMSSEFHDAGITQGRCIDPELIEKISKQQISGRRDSSQRKNCLCAPSVDIGAYNTCTNGCIYCYANFNHTIAAENRRKHDPGSELLRGSIKDFKQITVRDGNALKKEFSDQLKLF